MTFDELQYSQNADHRRALIINAFAFVIGLAVVFALLGASASVLGRFFVRYQTIIERIASMGIIIFGLHLLGVIRIPWLIREARTDLAKARGRLAGPVGSMIMGSAFGIGWTPCIGPVLASILAIASQASAVGLGMALLVVYALGLGVPFILMAGTLNWAADQNSIARIRRYMPQHTAASGTLLVAMGLLVFTGNLIQISSWITERFRTGLTL